MEVHGFRLHIESPPVVVVHLKYNAWWTNPFWSTEKTHNSPVQLWSKQLWTYFPLNENLFDVHLRISKMLHSSSRYHILTVSPLMAIHWGGKSTKKTSCRRKGLRSSYWESLESVERQPTCSPASHETGTVSASWFGLREVAQRWTLGIFPLFPRRSWRRDSPMVMAFSFVGKWVAKWFRYMECILVGGDCEKWK